MLSAKLKIVIASLAVLGAVCSPRLVYSGEKKQDSPPAKGAAQDAANEKTIRALIAQLSDESFEKREAAQMRLSAIGAPALEMLKKVAMDSKDAEVRERATRLVQEIQESGLQMVRSEFYHDFRKNGLSNEKLVITGPNALKWVEAEEKGVRVKLPAEKSMAANAQGRRVGSFFKEVPANAKSVDVRVIRIGPMAVVSVRQDDDKAFRVVNRVALGTEDVRFLRVGANPGGAPCAVDLRLVNLRVRAAGADALPILEGGKVVPQ